MCKYFKAFPWYFRYLLYFIFIVIIKVIWIKSFNDKSEKDILDRRNYLLYYLDNGGFKVTNMPSFIGEQFKGEWALVTSSMTVSALTNIAFEFPETKEQSRRAIDKIIQLTISEQSEFDNKRWNEHPLYSLEYGNGHIGYLGHLNFMLGAYHLIGGGSDYAELHREITNSLIHNLNEAPFPYLETYPGEIYTADNMVVYASIRLYDKIYKTDHEKLIKKWKEYTVTHLLDNHTGLIVTAIDSMGNGNNRSRGSWAGWNSFYIPFIDTVFARDQYEKIKKNFVINLPFGMKGCREYRDGVSSIGDIDSGPVIFGVSTSGTGFIIAGAKNSKDTVTYNGLLLTAEVFGSSVSWNKRRHYIFSPVVGEAIVLAMKTSYLWDDRFLNK
jgi:hypothetical protein